MCRFRIEYKDRPDAIMQQAKRMIEDYGGSFCASETRALFSVNTPLGRVDGICVLADSSTIRVTITKRPFLVPCSVIRERMVAAFVAAQAASVSGLETE